MDRIFEDSEVSEEGVGTIVDTTTPVFYVPLEQDPTKSNLMDPYTFTRYWQNELRLLSAIGLGALMDNKNKKTNSQPPYTIQNLVKRCFDDKTSNTYPQAVRIKIFRRSTALPSAPNSVPAGNNTMAPGKNTYYPMDRSVFFSFWYEVSKITHLKKFKELNVDVPENEIICPSIVDIERGMYEENISQIMSSSRCRDSRLKKLEKHPIVMLMQLVVWNEKVCCVPLHDLNGFEEFFELFSLEVSNPIIFDKLLYMTN